MDTRLYIEIKDQHGQKMTFAADCVVALFRREMWLSSGHAIPLVPGLAESIGAMLGNSEGFQVVPVEPMPTEAPP